LAPVKFVVSKGVKERVTVPVVMKLRMHNAGVNGAGWCEVDIW